MIFKFFVLWILAVVGIFINRIQRRFTMTKTVEQTISMLEMLPSQEQDLALELVKRLVLAWDPDYTKLTPDERIRLDAAENGEYVDSENIDWDN